MDASILASITAGVGYFAGSVITRWLTCRECTAALTEYRDRLATVTGQLADARARLDLRVKRAHEGACKGARTRHAKRIELPPVNVEWNGTEPVKVAPESGKDGTP